MKPTWNELCVNLWEKRKNIVLQGAPGTGKTYHVPELVVRLCNPEFDAENATREELMKIYNQLKDKKHVMFTTFHQSMDYEDWLEGLRPVVTETNQVTYKIEAGIFKKLCDKADKYVSTPIALTTKDIEISKDATIWGVILCRAGNNPIRKDCMKNDYIRIRWDEKDFIGGHVVFGTFSKTMKIGDVVLSCFSNKTIDAIGIVTGDYEWHDEFPKYKCVRKVEWLVKGLDEDISRMNGNKKLISQTVHRLKSMNIDKVKMILNKYKKLNALSDTPKPHVIVIDEINRGNVSKIFGELITLLEPDKRKGMNNAESVILPYSKEPFYIPSNVYLIATMNTADRSLGTLDYAIRRRFAFVTVKPKKIEEENFRADLFRKVSELFIANYDEYVDKEFEDTIKLMPAETLCEEYRPEDVWIGHSYFIMNGEDEVRSRLLYEIIPLLEEYVRDGVLTNEAQTTIDELYQLAIQS